MSKRTLFCLSKAARLLPLLGSLFLTPHFGQTALGDEDPFAAGVRTTPWLSPADEQKQFRLPEGFTATLVASETEIQKPLNMAFDELGRIWLACTVEYPYAAPLDKPAKDSIRVLEDTDGDGHFEKVTVFADGLNIPIGIYPWKGGCIAYSIPNIYHFEDVDGDGKCDKRTKLYGPFDHTRDTHGMCNAFRRGFDGWLYACHGFNNDSHVQGADGNKVHMNSGNTFRFKLDGSRIEHYTHGQVNPFGMCMDEYFNIFTADCHSKPIYQLIRGGYYPSFGKPHDGLGFVPSMMEHLHGSTAICGLVKYTGDNFPAKYRGNFLSGNVMTSRINHNAPKYLGSTIQAIEQPDFLACGDPWFRPVDLQVGPDGALYVLDFYNRIIGHYEVPLPHPGRDRTSGRIWKIAYSGKEEGTKPAKMPADWTKLSPEKILQQLGNGNLEHRLRVQHYLTDVVGPACLPAVLEQLKSADPTSPATIHLAWIADRLSPAGNDDIAKTFPLNQVKAPVLATHLRMIAASHVGGSLSTDTVSEALHAAENAPFAERAGADLLGTHPHWSLIKPILETLKNAPANDTLLSQSLKIALKDCMSVAGEQDPAWLSKLKLSSEQTKELVPICLAVPNASSAELLLQHLQTQDEPRETVIGYLQYAARYIPQDRVDSLVQLARKKFDSDLNLQASILAAVHTGLQQRGQNSTPALNTWAEEVCRQLLSDSQEESLAWTSLNLDGSPQPDSAWTVQIRISKDGDKGSQFVCSLPKGEQRTGIYRSHPFAAPKELDFWCAGHAGFPNEKLNGKNAIRLRDASTNELLQESPPPRNDTAEKIHWDLKAIQGRSVVVEIVDGDTANAYAWLAVGRFSHSPLNPSRTLPNQLTAAGLAGQFKIPALRNDFVNVLKRPHLSPTAFQAAGQVLTALRPDSRVSALVQVAGDSLVTDTQRQQIAEAVASSEEAPLRESIESLMKSIPQRLQTSVAEILSQDVSGAKTLLGLVSSGKVNAALLNFPSVQSKLEALGNDDVKKQRAELVANLPPMSQELDKLIAQRRADFQSAKSNVENGATIFKKNCAACHQIAGQGAVVGPQLDGIGLRGLERLTEDILDPNRNVDVAFRTSTLVLDDGQVLSGMVRREEGEQLILVDNKGKELSVQKASIEQQSKTALSLMPANISEITTPQEFNDLLSYLLSQRTAPKPKE